MKKKTLLIIGLIVILVTLTGATYAYWDFLTATDTINLDVGTGAILEKSVVVIAPEGKLLVPESAELGPNDVKEITLSYNVKLSKELSTSKNLTVTDSNKKIIDPLDGTFTNVDLDNLITVAITVGSGSTTLSTSNIPVTVIVSLKDPTSESDALALYNKRVTFTLTFAAV